MNIVVGVIIDGHQKNIERLATAVDDIMETLWL